MKTAYILSTVIATLFSQTALHASDMNKEDAPASMPSSAPAQVSLTDSMQMPVSESIQPMVASTSITSMPNDLKDKLVSYLLSNKKALEDIAEFAYDKNPKQVIDYAQTIDKAPLSEFKVITDVLSKDARELNALIKDKDGLLKNFFNTNNLNFISFQNLLKTIQKQNSAGTFDGIKAATHSMAHSFVDLLGPTLATPIHNVFHKEGSTLAVAKANVAQNKAYEKLNQHLNNIPLVGGTVDGLAKQLETVLTVKLGQGNSDIIGTIASHLSGLVANSINAKLVSNTSSDSATAVTVSTPAEF